MQASPLNRQMKYEPYALVGKGEPGNFRMRGCNPAGGGYRAIPEGTGDAEVMNYQRKRGFW